MGLKSRSVRFISLLRVPKHFDGVVIEIHDPVFVDSGLGVDGTFLFAIHLQGRVSDFYHQSDIEAGRVTVCVIANCTSNNSNIRFRFTLFECNRLLNSNMQTISEKGFQLFRNQLNARAVR